MSIYHFFVTIPMVVLLHFWSPDQTLNRPPPPEGTTEVHDIPYADGPRRTLDVYVPAPAAKPAPVVVFFHGGAWTTGSKDKYRYVGTALNTSGMLVITPDYRLFPAARFPAFMEDAAQAVAWVRANAARFGGDPYRLFLMGHSAGAQIATLLALDPGYLNHVGMSPEDVCGVIGLAGPYDFLPLADDNMKAVFGQVAELSRTQPINFANHPAPPMLLAVGTWDTVVDPASASEMASRLRSTGTSVTVGLYPYLTHKALVESVTTLLSFISPAREDILQFIGARACRRQLTHS